jgi:hypothetical protein
MPATVMHYKILFRQSEHQCLFTAYLTILSVSQDYVLLRHHCQNLISLPSAWPNAPLEMTPLEERGYGKVVTGEVFYICQKQLQMSMEKCWKDD